MTYDEIYKPLSRTSFASKMKRAFYASIDVMSPCGQAESSVIRRVLLPDEIETFVMNCIMTKEYSNKEMTNSQFCDVMNAIRKFQPPSFYQRLKTEGLKWILPTIGAIQFESQEYIWFRLYRHHYLFSFENEVIDVGRTFEEKFDHSFDDYASIVFILHMLLAGKEITIYEDYLEKIIREATWFVKNLMMTREQYREELNQFAKSSADYKYCLRPSYSYPFIEYQETIFLPTPHLLVQSITTAMMNRLTFDDLSLREKIGKNACESYLLQIIIDSGLFDEVIPEFEYKKGNRTLDVLTRKDNIALLIDSKLFSPKAALRTYDDRAYESDRTRIAKSIRTTYIQAYNKFNHEYYPFAKDVEEVFALVVVYQEGYLDLAEIYEEAARDLSIALDSLEFKWLWHHVGLTDIANIERFFLTKTDLIPELKNRDAISDKWLTGQNNTSLTDELINFQGEIDNIADELHFKLYNNQK